ncbi:hypothetical protein FHS57_000977 [Runella defluvii]|uniref:DUF4231 domain-containing protein n=1 Tax=Runella defluvii TaxID=370973 RepID=A0A7W5ZI08_9BACT|nr:hypothetical protein [Runella defluvii]MBB3836995.1 hypothetical protein [Runella defluvii]
MKFRTFIEALEYYDTQAIRFKNHFILRNWLAGIGCGLIAVILFSTLVAFHAYLPPLWAGVVLPTAEVLLVAGSFVLLGYSASRAKLRFLQHRHWAEYLRVRTLFTENGLPLITTPLNYKEGMRATDKIHFKIPSELRELEKSYVPVPTHVYNLFEIKQSLITFINSQQKYHTEIRIEGYEEKEHRLEFWLKVILYVFGGVVVAKYAFEWMEYTHSPFIHEHLYLLKATKFLVIFLPPLYAALEGIYYFSEWKRNIRISQKVHERYENVRVKIEESQDPAQLQEAAKSLYRLFMGEHIDWLNWYQNKKVEAKV